MLDLLQKRRNQGKRKMIPPISTILTFRKLPLLLHIIIESAAAYTFILKPSCQLPPSLLQSTSNADQTSPSSPSGLSTSTSSSSCPCHSPEEIYQQPSKRYLSPSPSSSSSSSSSPNIRPLDPCRHKDNPKDGRNIPTSSPEQENATSIKELNLILLNYGGLLLTSNLICLVFIFRPVFDELSGPVSLCMATYHVWPVYRALVRIRMSNTRTNTDRKGAPGKKILGGPVVHLLVHLGLLGGLVLGGLA